MKRKRTNYTPEFKQKAIERARELGSLRRASEELGIIYNVLLNWQKEYGSVKEKPKTIKLPSNLQIDQSKIGNSELLFLREENAKLKRIIKELLG